jgi:hypothetical protein
MRRVVSVLLALPAAILGIALPAQAILIPVGDPQVYSIIQFYALDGPNLYITPNPVAASGSLGLLEGMTDGGFSAGTAFTSGFGLYGATAHWPGNGRHDNGMRIAGAAASLIYDQRYQAIDEHSLVHLNVFGVALDAVDPDRNQISNYFAGFQMMVQLLPLHPEAPGFNDVANFDFNPPASQYALRMLGSVGGRDGNFSSSFDCTYCDLRGDNPVPTVERSPLGIRFTLPDISLDLFEVIPRDNQYTVRTYLSVQAFGPRGEGGSRAQFFDPILGYGGQVGPSENSAVVPEPGTRFLVGLGVLALGATFRRRSTPRGSALNS